MKKNWKKGKLRPPKHEQHSDYHKIWRMVDGAIRDTFRHHPEYLADEQDARVVGRSLAKRITGEIVGAGIYSLAAMPRGKPD